MIRCTVGNCSRTTCRAHVHQKYVTKVTHDFLISALDDAILFLRVSCGEGMLDLRQACKLCEELVAKSGTLVSVNDVGSCESTEVLKDAPGSLGRDRRLRGE